MEKRDIAIIGINVIYLLFLYFLGDNKKMQGILQARFLFCVPFTVTGVYIAKTDFELCLLGLYIGVVLPVFCFFTDDRKQRKRLCTLAIGCILVTIVPCQVYPGYRNPCYTEEFIEGFTVMREHYVLSEHKAVDWDSLYAEYVPLFQEADRTKDPELAYDAWERFTKSFRDVHVSSVLHHGDAEAYEAYGKRHVGYDYGFSLVTLEDGRTVFANVDEKSKAFAMGIRDGMTMDTFDGQEIDKAKENGEIWFSAFPDKENAAFYQSLAVTSSGGQTISLSYQDDRGQEQTIGLSEQGNGYERFMDTYQKMQGGGEQTNLSCGMVSKDTACIVLNDMCVDSGVRYGEETDTMQQYAGVKAKIKALLESAKADGARHLILDLRGNRGGYLDMSVALASLFISKETFGVAEGQYQKDMRRYEITRTVNIEPENAWGDGEITILVNSNTASAAELFVYMMSGLDNVTVMGMTKSAGSAMGTSCIGLERMDLYFPMVLLLDEHADVLIDSGADGISGMPLDVRIPMDDKAFTAIFEKGEDYVLSYAVDHMED